jgi:hypothetical protein
MDGGVYSNLALINHSQTEFVVDFIQVMPGTPKAKVRARVVLTPQHAKRVMKALMGNVSRYESQNGEIVLKGGDEAQYTGPVNFGGPQGEA